MQKLTLGIDERVIANAKRYAEAHGTSVSKLVESYLSLVARPTAKDPKGLQRVPPVLGRLRGSLRKGTVADYRRHLEQKHR